MASQYENVRQSRILFYRDFLDKLQAEPESVYRQSSIESVRELLRQCEESEDAGVEAEELIR